MLRELLYEMLMKATNLARGIWILEDLFNMEKNIFGRTLIGLGNILNKILTVCFWIGWHLFMISITGGLWLIWIGFKLMRKSNKRKHNKKQTKRRA